jgi:hypothetical protein
VTRGFTLSARDFAGRSERHAPTADLQTELTERLALYDALLAEADGNERQLKAALSQQQYEVLDLSADLEVARDHLHSQEATIRLLRKRLVDAERFTDAYALTDATDPLPKSFGEILERFAELQPQLIFTGSHDHCLDLDEHPQSSPWAQVCWEALTAMGDYIRTKREAGFDGDFRRWCETPVPDGRVISPGRVASDESDAVRNNPKFARVRTLPVPMGVDRSGKVFMGSHIKLSNSSTIAPRIHFYETVLDERRVILVGYIGRHLPNTLTS